MRIFWASILNFVLFQCYLSINNKILGKIFLIGPLWGELRLFRIVLRLRGMKKNFKIGQIFFLFFKSYVTLKYFLIIDFPKFDPLTAAGMALCVNLGPKCQKFLPLVSDQAESSLA
jgi:hypothetical protein